MLSRQIKEEQLKPKVTIHYGTQWVKVCSVCSNQPDQIVRHTLSLLFVSPTTAQKCHAHCEEGGYFYYAVQWGIECW